jgi:hypothetical protein
MNMQLLRHVGMYCMYSLFALCLLAAAGYWKSLGLWCVAIVPFGLSLRQVLLYWKVMRD